MPAVFAQGTLLKKGDGGGPEVFTTVAMVKSITGPTLQGEDIDITNQDSPGGFREFINGLIDPGELSFEINYDPGDATHDAATGLLGDLTSRSVINWELIFPDTGSTKWTFSGSVKSFEANIPVDDVLSASITIKITGLPVFNA